ncbi:MAG: hypothetical protein ACJAX5_002827 [Patiriisocius sp.]|jgi:hypothetical protein
MSRTLTVVIFLLAVSSSSAAEVPAELMQCRGIPSLALRLQCYDRFVDGFPAINVTSTVSPAKPAAVRPTASSRPVEASVVQSEPVEEIKAEELFGKSAEQVKEAVNKQLEVKDVDQISSKVTRISINTSKEYVVYLENGQVWRQTNKPGKWRIKVGETAVISKAYLGSYLMKSDARKKSVRAERIR